MAQSNTGDSGRAWIDTIIDLISLTPTHATLRYHALLTTRPVEDGTNAFTATGNWSRSGAFALQGRAYNAELIWWQDVTFPRAAVDTTAVGNLSFSGVEFWGTTLSVSDSYVVPAAPSGPSRPATPTLTVTSVSSSSLKVSKTYPSDPTGNEWKVTATADRTSASVGAYQTNAAQVMTVTGLAPGTQFWVWSRTQTAGSGMQWSDWAFVSRHTNQVAPSAATAVSAVRNSDAQATVSWKNNPGTNSPITRTVVQQSVNGGAWTTVATLKNVASAVVATAPNRRTQYRVQSSNGAGVAPWSAASAAIFTTPAAPDSCTATKQADGSIVVAWANKAGFSEYQTQVWHGLADGTGWDATPLETLEAGDAAYTHRAPDLTKPHVYRVRAVNTTGGLASECAQSNTVLGLAPPNAPTLAALASFSDAEAPLRLSWAHNPTDTSAQRRFQVRSSPDGTTWTELPATTSTEQATVIAAPGAGVAGQVRRYQVRTWGAATTGGSDGAGASPWSATAQTTFATVPDVSVLSPGALVAGSSTDVVIGFAQGQGATLVRATAVLALAGVTVETAQSTTATIPLRTRLVNGGVYELTVTALDSHGLSSTVTVTFAVDYPAPHPAVITPTYLAEHGVVQLTVSVDPDSGATDPVAVTITRSIDDGVPEALVDRLPWDGVEPLTVLDTTPTIRGVNTYEAVTFSADDAAADPHTIDVVTAEDRWAFLNSGPGYSLMVSFFGNLTLGATPVRESALVKAAGRTAPIALFGQTTSLDVSGAADLVDGVGSSAQEIEEFLLTAGRACYRDPSGRRIFGRVTGSISEWQAGTAKLEYTVSEAT